MPFANYKDFNDCVQKNQDKEKPEAYCAEIKRKVEGDMQLRSKSEGGGLMPDSEQDTLEPGFYQRGEQLFKVDKEGRVFEMDFDNQEDSQWIQGAIKHPGAFKAYCKSQGMVDKEGNVTSECIAAGKKSSDPKIRKRAQLADTLRGMKKKGDFLTFEEVEEAFENSIKNNIEVETDMKDKTEKPDEQNKTEDITEDAQSTSENLARETVDICRKEYDFLKAKYEELKSIQEEKATIEQKFEAFKEDFKKLKESVDAERAEKIEEERVKKVEQIAKDFDIPKEKLEGKSLDMLVEYEEMLDLAIKRNAPEESKEDFTVSEPDGSVEDMITKMQERYRLDV